MQVKSFRLIIPHIALQLSSQQVGRPVSTILLPRTFTLARLFASLALIPNKEACNGKRQGICRRYGNTMNEDKYQCQW